MDPALVRLVALAPESLECLTPRQREVWGLLRSDFNLSAAAKRLGISRHAVQCHVRLILPKLVRFAEAASEE